MLIPDQIHACRSGLSPCSACEGDKRALAAEVERLTRQAEMDITAGLAVSRLLGEKDAEIERMRSFLAARHLLVDYNLLQEKFKRQRG